MPLRKLLPLSALLASSSTGFAPLQQRAVLGLSSKRQTTESDPITQLGVFSEKKTKFTDYSTIAEPSPPSDNNEYQVEQGMGDLSKFLKEDDDEELSPEKLLIPVVLAIAAVAAAAASSLGLSMSDVSATAMHFFHDPKTTLSLVVEGVKDMGPQGAIYFGLFYMLAELLAIPATPLTLSAGYLFGLTNGVLIVLGAGTVAASLGFLIGRNVLRGWVEGVLKENPTLAKIDRAVGEQGFKLLVLLRLSPIFPFALSNYVYGASSIRFSSYFWGTVLGFTPGTIGYVYTGMVGKELLLGEGAQPWYVYAGGLAVLVGLLKLVTDVASGIVEAIDDEDTTTV